MTPTSYLDDTSWTYECLVDNIFVNLMENGCDIDKKSNKYVLQFIDKFRYFRRRSPSTYFEINKKDLSAETINQLESYTKYCRTTGERYSKMDGVIVEAIARIAKQAQPEILSSCTDDDNRDLLKVALWEIREMVSFQWTFVDGENGDKNKNE